MKKSRTELNKENLRKRAEDIFKKNASGKKLNYNEFDTMKLVHELQVHQIELELQNEELKRANQLAEEAADNYTELYDFAPTGYFTLSGKGEIIRLNLAGAELLAKERSMLINKLFTSFVQIQHRPVFIQFLERVIKSSVKEHCEIVLSNGEHSSKYLSLTGNLNKKGDELFITAEDITSQKMLNEELEESRILLTDTQTSGKIGGWKFDVGTFNQVWTDEIFRILEIDISGGAPKVPEGLGFIDPAFREMAEKGMQRAIEYGEPYDQEWVVTTAKGNKRWVHSIGKAKQENGKTVSLMGSFQDITLRKNAEEMLRKSEQDNLQLIQNLHSGVVVHAADSSIISANKAASEMLGLSEDQLQGKVAIDDDWYFIYRDGARMPVEDYPVMRTISSLNPLENYVLGVNNPKKKSIVWGLVNAFPELDDGGQLLKVVVTFTNITQLVKVEDELRESKQIIEGIINTIPARVFWKDRDLKYLGCNKAFAMDAGFDDPKEIIGKDDYQMSWSNLAEQYRKDDLEVIESGKDKFNIEEMLNTADGQSIALLTNKSALRDAFGKINGVLGTFFDITERKQVEKALRESEERFMLAMKASSDGLFDLNLITNEIYYSPGWKKMLGYADHELPNDISTWENLTKPEDVKNSKEQQPRLINREIDRFVTEFKMKHKDGHWVDILSHAEAFFDDSGKAVRIVGTHTDITQRKLAEEMIREKDIQFRKLSANVPDLIYQFTRKPDGSYFVPIASEGIKNIFGCSPGDVLDDFTPISRVIYPEDAGRVMADIEYSAKHLTYFTCEFRVQIPGREIQWIFSRSTPEKLPDGSITWYGFNVDITERKKAEEAILVSEEKFRSIAEQTSDLISLTDSHGKLIYASSAAKELFYYSPKEMVGRNFIEFLIEADIPKAFEMFKNSIEKGEKVKGLELTMKRKDGSQFIGELNGSLFRSGSQDGTIVNIRNITERKLVEEQINLITERLQLSTESAGIGIWDLNLQDNSLIWDKRMYELYGIDEHDFENTYEAWKKATHPDDLSRVESELQNAIKGKEEFHTQFRIVLPEGQIRFIEAHATVHCNADGSDARMIGVNRDITFQKESEIQLRSILENSPTGFAINIISTGEVTYVNKAFSDIYHVPPELCESVSTFFDYVYRDQPELGQKIIDDVMSGIPERMKWEAIPVTDKSTGNLYYISAANIILKDLDLMISSVWDVTERIENEKRLLEAVERAKESDRLKSAFLANMSHEIRTPMNGILGFADLLKEPGLSGEQQQKYIGIIQKSGVRMLNIINDIVDISKIEAGLVEVSVSETNIKDQLQFIYTFFKPEAVNKGLQISLQDNLSVKDAIIKTDREKIYAVLSNLVKNAIKYTNEGSIEIGCKSLGEHTPELLLWIKDTGIGVAYERQEAIFERFIQADIADSKAFQGAGLGLSISKAYVEMLGGRIWVESNEQSQENGQGSGSTFYFTIPCSEKKIEKVAPQHIISDSVATSPAKKLKILIAEDDESSALLLNINLRLHSKELLLVESGNEAVDACRNQPDIDLVLMDIKMPGISGYEATHQIRQFNKDVIIIAQTAHGLSGDHEKAIEAGCNDYISKPIKKESLIALLEKWFAK